MKIMSVDAKKRLVTGYGSIDLDPAKVQESFKSGTDYIASNINALLTKNVIGSLKSDRVALGLPAARTFTRTFSLSANSEDKLHSAVELEVEQYIPIPMSSLYVDYEIIERTKDQITVLMTAIPRPIVDACMHAAEAAGLQVVLVEPSINSVARLIEITEEGHLPTVIVDIGPAGTDIAILDGSIRVVGSLSVGGNTFTLDIAKKLKVPLETAHQLKVINGLSPGARQHKITQAIDPSLKKIVSETRKVMRYYDERIANHRKLEQVLIVGGGANVPGIGDYFTNELVMPSRVASPWQNIDFGKLRQPAKHFRSRYITVAGLASIPHERIWS